MHNREILEISVKEVCRRQVKQNITKIIISVLNLNIFHSIAQAIDRNGNLFFILMDPPSIACWDSSKPYTNENIRIVHRNDQTLQFAAGVKVKQNLNGDEELWILTNRFQKFMNGNMNLSENNFRILRANIRELLNGRMQCDG